MEDFQMWTRPRLAEYLKEIDFAASGIKKDDLVILATKATELNVPLLEKDDTLECIDTFRTVDDQLISTEGKYSSILTKLPPLKNIQYAHILYTDSVSQYPESESSYTMPSLCVFNQYTVTIALET